MHDRAPLTIFAAVVSGLAYASGAQAAGEASSICHQLNLSSTAEGDCEQQMGSALTDADRAKVIHTFASGLATTRADTLIGQLSSPASAAPPALSPAASPAAADRAGAKAKPQRTQMAPKDQPPAKPKGQKTSHQPPDKPAEKSGQ